jgi:hypothetical protein
MRQGKGKGADELSFGASRASLSEVSAIWCFTTIMY